MWSEKIFVEIQSKCDSENQIIFAVSGESDQSELTRTRNPCRWTSKLKADRRMRADFSDHKTDSTVSFRHRRVNFCSINTRAREHPAEFIKLQHGRLERRFTAERMEQRRCRIKLHVWEISSDCAAVIMALNVAFLAFKSFVSSSALTRSNWKTHTKQSWCPENVCAPL